MPDKPSTYDTPGARQIDLERLVELMSAAGAEDIYIKKLAPNDNSKNQPYFGGHLTDLPFIPTGPVQASLSTSNKSRDSSRQIKYQASVKLTWLDAEGHQYPAPNAKLIYYPQYPEVRFSGFLSGSKISLSRWMSPQKKGRAENRWLLLGVSGDGAVYGFLATPESLLSKQLEATELTPATKVFYEIDVSDRHSVKDTRVALLHKLLEIHEMRWIPGQKLGSDKITKPYLAANGGGYTLESLLGISPNGVAEPDYLGWEVKQFGVRDFPRKSAKPTTLMTPEPDGGVYSLEGAAAFVRRFGYADKSGIADRLNFGGRHKALKECAATRLTLRLDGFDSDTRKITDAAGAITLVDGDRAIAASWSFPKLMDHWKRKHAKAVYVPCIMRAVRGGREYAYGSDLELGIGTNFELFLSAMLSGYIYYDPGIKLENASKTRPKLKRRSQFRVNHTYLGELYDVLEFVDSASQRSRLGP